MSKSTHGFSLMILPKRFISLLGAEYELMRKAGGKVLSKFYLASLGIFIISIITFLSVRYAIELLFHITIVEIVLSVFISALFLILYIFLINTFSKKKPIEKVELTPELNQTEPVKNTWYKQKGLWTLTNISRTGFILFMAFILSKPIEIFFLRNILNDKVEVYKKGLIQEHTKKIEELFAEEEVKLKNEIASKELLNAYHATDAEILRLTQSLDSIQLKKKVLINNAESRINLNSFFIYRTRLSVSKFPLSWLIWAIVTVIFLFPGYLIYSIGHEEEYYRLKSAMENNMILHAWSLFNEQYTDLFKRKYGYETSFFSLYEDPPFNTKRKSTPSHLQTDDFFSKYLNTDRGL